MKRYVVSCVHVLAFLLCACPPTRVVQPDILFFAVASLVGYAHGPTVREVALSATCLPYLLIVGGPHCAFFLIVVLVLSVGFPRISPLFATVGLLVWGSVDWKGEPHLDMWRLVTVANPWHLRWLIEAHFWGGAYAILMSMVSASLTVGRLWSKWEKVLQTRCYVEATKVA